MNLPKLFSLVNVIKVLVAVVAILGIIYFYQLNSRNLFWCASKGDLCKIARIADQIEVAKKAEALVQK